jgi:tripartite-type tricarboxylate transporter receptor subunit TctC
MSYKAILVCAAATAFWSGGSTALAQTYPTKPVEIINPYPPGGATDIMGRALMDGLSKEFKRPFIFVNRPGANGAIGTNAVARAAPDGHSLLFTAAVSIVVNPLTQPQAAPYTHKSFDHLCQTFKNEMVIVVHPESPFKTVADIVKAAEEKPGALNYGILGIGSIPHLVMVELSQAAKVELNAIPFKGDADVLAQVMGKHVPLGAAVLASAVRSNVRIVGLFAKQRNPSIPDVPTIAEQGYPVAPASIGGLSAPAGIPAEVKARLESACKVVAESDSYRKLMKSIHQPDDYYDSGPAYSKALADDSEVKRRMLDQLGMVKQ